MTSAAPRIGFVLELSLGHGTHAANLNRVLPAQSSIRADVRTVSIELSGLGARIPVYRSNWTVRSGIQSLRAITSMRRRGKVDALFIHTQVPAVLSQPWMLRIPTVVSLDATPLQYDEFGAYYDHARGSARAERFRYRANRSCFNRAVHLVTWSEWAKEGAIEGYGVPADHITVLSPGVIPSLWNRPASAERSPGPIRILFVGADFVRKGGDVLVEAFTRMRAAMASRPGVNPDHLPQLDLVTAASVEEQPGVHVHQGLRPNTPELIALYHGADIFCLPTRADCLGLALAEAGAAGLPLVATDVGGIPEIVRDNETGLLVPPGDVDALVHALGALVDDPALRARLGGAAHQLVNTRHDAEVNTKVLVDLMADLAARHRR